MTIDFINVNYRDCFSTDSGLDYFLNYAGDMHYLSQDSISDVAKITLSGQKFFLKRYQKPGKHLLRKLSRFTRYIQSRAAREFSNLLYFSNNGFNTPEVIFFAEHKGRSCLITKEIEDSYNLSEYYSKHKVNKTNFIYLLKFTEIIRALHKQGFIHRDYKLRNVLIDNNGKLYLIDCPSGFTDYSKIFFNRFVTHDFTVIYKDLKKVLSATQMLRLYKHYYELDNTKLTIFHKNNVSKIVNYNK